MTGRDTIMEDAVIRRQHALILPAILLATTWLALAPTPANAQGGNTIYVSDQLEITLRRGKGTRFGISAMLESGTQLTVLEQDPESGYSQVRTPGGTEGWVLTRFTQPQPVARTQVQAATNARRRAETRAEQLKAELDDLQSNNAEMRRRIQVLEAESASSADELRRVSAAAARPMEIQRQNDSLTKQVRELEQDRDRLTSQLRAEQSQRENWIMGALIMGTGIFIGLFAPMLRRRKSGWEGLG